MAAAIVVVLAGSLAFLASGQEASVSTTDGPTSPPAEEPPTATDETTTTSLTTSTTSTTTPQTTTSTTVVAAEEPAPPPPTDPPPSPDPGVQLMGKTFTGTSVTEAGRPRALVEGTEITVTFERNRQTGEDGVRWNAGCNTAGAAVSVSADRLDVGNEVGSTAAGCDQDRQNQDEWLVRFFSSDPHWRLDAGTLTLTVDDVVITLTEQG